MTGGLKSAFIDLRTYPRALWVLLVGTFVYCAGSGLAFPLEGIYLRTHLHASWFTIGVLFGLLGSLAAPFQIVGGAVTDRVGRRITMIIAAISGVVWFVGFAFADQAWQVGVLVIVESALGWPLFLTSSNAMIADLLPQQKRANAYSLIRTAMNVGVVLGPALGGLALGLGVSFRDIFLAAAAGCAGFLVLILIWIEETRPASARAGGRRQARRLRRRAARPALPGVLRRRPPSADPLRPVRRHLLDLHHDRDGREVQHLASAPRPQRKHGIVAALQLGAIAPSRGRDPMRLMALASLLIAIGVGGVAFAHSLATLVLLVVGLEHR